MNMMLYLLLLQPASPTLQAVQAEALPSDSGTGDLAASAILGAEKTVGGLVSGQDAAESLLNILWFRMCMCVCARIYDIDS